MSNTEHHGEFIDFYPGEIAMNPPERPVSDALGVAFRASLFKKSNMSFIPQRGSFGQEDVPSPECN